MPIIKKTRPKKSKAGGGTRRSPSAARAPEVAGAGGLTLPTELSEPVDDLSGFSWLLYGEKKIGKTTLLSQFPAPFFLATEPGHKALRTHFRYPTNWKELVGYVELLEEDDTFETVILDVTDRAYGYCFDAICKLNHVEHPSDDSQEWGRIWSEIGREWERIVMRLLSLEKGVVFVSHADLRTVKRRDGEEYDQLRATLSGQSLKKVEGLVDVIAYYGYAPNPADGRELVIRGDSFIDAGCRIREHFQTPDGEQVVSINMGSSEEEAYANLTAAFNNEQEDAGAIPFIAPKKRKKGK